MTPLPWVRLDVGFPRNRKILDLLAQRNGHRAALCYVCSLAYSGEQGTGGWIPHEALGHIHGSPALAQKIVAADLWLPHPGGWAIHDWDAHQPSSEEMQRRSQRARAAAYVRWSQRR